MLLALIIGVVVAAVAVMRGGSLETLADTRFRWTGVLVGALVVQVGADVWSPEWLDGWRGVAILLSTNAVVLAVVVKNLELPGMVLGALGLALNVIAIAANGAMPVSRRAAQIAGMEGVFEDPGVKHEWLGDDTRLPWLTDVIPLPGLIQVISIGDIVLAIGIARLIYVRATSNKKTAAQAS